MSLPNSFDLSSGFFSHEIFPEFKFYLFELVNIFIVIFFVVFIFLLLFSKLVFLGLHLITLFIFNLNIKTVIFLNLFPLEQYSSNRILAELILKLLLIEVHVEYSFLFLVLVLIVDIFFLAISELYTGDFFTV